MKDVKLTVKDEGIKLFIQKYASATNEREQGRDMSPYYLMKDILYLKNDCGLIKGDILKIELLDNTYGSQKKLTNHYWYEAAIYDDIVIQMVLVNFEIVIN